MKLDQKALDTSAVGLNGWMADADKTPAARAVIERYLAAIGETHVVVPREPVAWIGQGTIPIRADEYERLKERSPGEASVFTTPLYAAAKEVE